jgi:uncharacterized protein (DUF427 family)
MLTPTPDILRSRRKWLYRGQKRPPFAEPCGPGEISVWDFPRPPRLESVADVLKVEDGSSNIARTTHGMRVLETAGAPTYYFPPEDVREERLVELDGLSVCEWKGVATSFALVEDRARQAVAWCYRDTFPEFAGIRDWYAFYPGRLSCCVGDERVTAQPGGYYGGWVTGDLTGPIKGAPGSGHW